MGGCREAEMISVAWVPSSSNLRTASARLRCYNVVAALAGKGCDIRVVDLDDFRPHQVVVLSKRYDPAAVEFALRTTRSGGTAILDLCDNHFYAQVACADADRRRQHLGRMLEAVQHLVVSTTTLADVVRAETCYGGPITIIGDPVDDLSLANVPLGARDVFGFARMEPLRRRVLRAKRRHQVRLVWFGAHGVSYADGGMLDLLQVRDLLVRLSSRYDLSLTVISNSWSKYLRHIRGFGVPTRYFEWNPRSFSELVAAHDVCIVPICSNPFTMCKSNNRVATALWHGVPVVANSIPSYEELRRFIVLDDWEQGLTQYLEQPATGAEHVRTGREYLCAHYSLNTIARQWADVFGTVTRAKEFHAG
jgi:glycosyltransferase involved in cell wall biosynthesis